MQKVSSLICLLVAFSGPIFGAPLDGKGDCPGGYPNGAPVERGYFLYECRDGAIVPKGCLADGGKKVDVGGTVDRKTYQLTCQLAGDGMLSLDPTACLQDGQAHKIGDQWESSTNFYTCKQDGTELRTVNSGCVDQGKRVPLGEQVTKDDFAFVCNETVNNGARLMPAGCVKDGKQYKVGDTFESGKFWFTCTRMGREKVAAKASGCVNAGKRLNDGDRFFDQDVIFECTIDNDKNDVRTVGCAQRDEKGDVVERRLGCTWVEGPAPFQYEVACQPDAANNSAKKVQVRCNYNQGGGVHQIAPGCYRLIEKSAFGCSSEASGLKLQSFQGDNAETAAQGAGLHAC